MKTIKSPVATAWSTIWNAQATSAGAYFHTAFMFVVAVVMSTVKMQVGTFDTEGLIFRLIWIVVATGWALRMLYLADQEPDGSRQQWLSRRGGLIISTLMLVALLAV